MQLDYEKKKIKNEDKLNLKTWSRVLHKFKFGHIATLKNHLPPNPHAHWVN